MTLRINLFNNLLNKNKHVRISFGAKINRVSFFEGFNFIGRYSRIINTKLGFATYIGVNSNLSNCQIGRYCSIGSNVNVVNGLHPTKNFVSTHPSFYAIKNSINLTYIKNQKFSEQKYVDGVNYIVIGNDVWIGNNVLLISGIKIGDGAVIAAGSVVTKDVESYSIVGGVPAKIIKYRFSDDVINQLKSIEWWSQDQNWIKKNAELFDNIDNFFSNQNNK